MIDHISKAIQNKVKKHYEKGEGSIQDIARVYRLEVSEVLEIVDNQDVSTVHTIGDLIDQKEAGSEVSVNSRGKSYDVPFTIN